MTPFEIALQKRKQLEEEKKQDEERKKSKDYQKDYEHIEWLGITEQPKVFRVVGLPVEVRQNNFDPKIVYWSKIVSDTGKSFINVYNPILQDGELDESYIMSRLYNKVFESEWVAYKEGELRDPSRRGNDKGYYVSKNEGKPSYIRIDKNKKEGSNQFGHFKPKKRILLNILDRMDSWCKENRHTKILTTNYSPFSITDKDGKPKTIYFNDVGVSEPIYSLLYNQVLEFRSHWDLDIILYKEDKKYIMRDCFEDKIKPEVKKYVVQSAMSEEESSYDKYDLDKLFPTTSYYKLMNNFESLFKQVDLDLKTNFYDELKHFYEEEKKNKEKESSNTTTHSVIEDVPKTEVLQEEKVEEEKVIPVSNTRRSVTPTNEDESIQSKLEKLPNWIALTSEDKEVMISTCNSIKENKFSYKEGTAVLPCPCDKRIDFPDTVWNCSVCGIKFE
jgi:hypothetical protein